MNKEVETKVGHISKMDEDRAVNFIKKVYGKIYPELAKNLKEIAHRNHGGLINDGIEYESIIGNQPAVFYIRKWGGNIHTSMKIKEDWFRKQKWVNIDDKNAENMINENTERMSPNLITKEEEQRAFQVISRKLIPMATEVFNAGVAYNKSSDINPITETEVRKYIKKKARMKHSPEALNRSMYDVVRYEAVVNDGEQLIIFDIHKSPGTLYVEWSHRFKEYGKKLYGSHHDDKAVVYTNSPGVYTSVYGSVIKEAADPGMRITKIEELAAYDYLIKVVVPKAIEELYMKFLKKHPGQYTNIRRYPRVTAENVVKNLRKQRVDVDSVSYESVINDHVAFAFFLKKGEVKIPPRYPGEKEERKENRLIIGAQGPINTDWNWYPVENV